MNEIHTLHVIECITLAKPLKVLLFFILATEKYKVKSIKICEHIVVLIIKIPCLPAFKYIYEETFNARALLNILFFF